MTAPKKTLRKSGRGRGARLRGRSVREGYVRALIKSSKHTVNHRRMTRAYYVWDHLGSGPFSAFFCRDLPHGTFSTQQRSVQWPFHVSGLPCIRKRVNADTLQLRTD